MFSKYFITWFYQFIYNKIRIVKRDCEGSKNQVAGRILDFTWDDNSLQGNGSTTDVMNVICYSEELNAFEMNEGVATRADGAAQITLPTYFDGAVVHVWIYFNNDQQKLACNSPYLGLITLI